MLFRSSALTLSTAILIHRIALPGYEALTLLIASTVLLELGLRNLPSELRLPSAVMNVVGLGSLLVTHVADVQKHPAPETLISFGGAALLYYFFTARLLRSSNPNAIPARAITTTLGSVLTLATLWMIVPEGAMPFAMMPSASSPWKPASRATRTISSGMPAR